MNFVDNNGCLENENLDVGAKHAETYVNISLTPAFDSSERSKRCSSSESIYEIVAESINGDSENEIFDSDCEADLHNHSDGKVDGYETSGNLNQNNGLQDPSNSDEMDEEFVIIDDDNDAIDGKSDCNKGISDAKRNLQSCDKINGILEDSAAEADKIATRLSDNGDQVQSVVENHVAEKKDEKKDARVILPSDDEDEIGDILDGLDGGLLEIGSSDENSNLEKSDAASTTVNTKSDTSASTELAILKSSTGEVLNNVNNKNTSFNSDLKNTCNGNNSAGNSISRTNSATKKETVCEIETILADDKSNDSVEIIDIDDSPVKEKPQIKHSKEISQTTLPKFNSPLNSPASFSSSSEDKFEFDNKMILDIVKDSTPEKASKNDDSHLKSGEFLLSDCARNSLLKSFMSKNSDSASSVHKSANIELSELTSKNLQTEEKSNSATPSTSVLSDTENTQLCVNKLSSDNAKRSDEFFNCNGDVSTSSDFSSTTKENKSSESDAQDDSNRSTAIKLDGIDNDELITTNVCSKRATCDENQKSNDSEVSIVDFPSELLIGENSQTVESLKVKQDKSSSVTTNSEQFRTDKSDVDDKTESELKSDVGSKTSNDDVIMEEEKLGEKSDNVEKTSDKVEEKQIDNDVKTDAQLKADPSPKSDNSAENKTTNLVKLENVDSECQEPEKVPIKRKLESGDNEDDVKIKKLRNEDEDKEDTKLFNGDISSVSSDDLKLKEEKSKEAANELQAMILQTANSLVEMMGEPNKKLKIFKNELKQLSLGLYLQPWKDEYKEALDTMQVLEDKIQLLNNTIEKYSKKLNECREFQRNKFAQSNFKPKIQTRTVGVNVKIYRESELKHAMLATKTKVEGKNCTPLPGPTIKKDISIVPKTEPSKNMNALPDNKSLLPNMHIKDTIMSPTIPSQQVVRKQLMPRIITGQGPRTVNKIVTIPNRVPPPNVTVAGNKFFSVGRPSQAPVMFVPSSTITSSSNTQQVQKVVAAGMTTTASGSAVGKINVPNMPGNPNVLVPLKDYLQLLPPGSKGTAVIQQNVGSRPGLIPPLPSNLVGARTVTYIVPQNSPLANARGIAPFIPSQNQQVQFVLRVTNSGTMSGLNSVVNTIARPVNTATRPAIMQPPLATAPRFQPPMATTSQPPSQPVAQSPTAQPPRNTGLILISHTSKPNNSTEKKSEITLTQTQNLGQGASMTETHPAPFPKTPHYPDNKGKAIPPKPALKGSKNQSGGIVLSWNMNLTQKNANIASYQLFAYQETDGPVDASLWKKVGDVNALPLPMACTLTQFVDKNRYYFTVRAVDVFQRFGPFSDPVSILFEKEGENAKKDK